jgi:hypothetical protein
VDPVTDPLLLRKSGSAGNRTRDFSICSQALWSLDHSFPSTQRSQRTSYYLSRSAWVKIVFCVTNCVRQLQCLRSWYSARHSPRANSNQCVYNSANAGKIFIVFVPLDMRNMVVAMATKTAFVLFLLCFVQVSKTFCFHSNRHRGLIILHTAACTGSSIVCVSVLLYRHIM